MHFDLRLPIGLLFTAIGLLVGGFGAAQPSRAMSLGVNVDLAWGAVLFVLGVALLGVVLAGRRRSARP